MTESYDILIFPETAKVQRCVSAIVKKKKIKETTKLFHSGLSFYIPTIIV